MDPKRKRIYIIIIVVCVLGSAIVLLSGRVSAPPTLNSAPSSALTVTNTPNVPIVPDANGNYPAPNVFPNSTDLNLSVFNSNNFKSLQADTTLNLGATDLGRSNPFASY